MTASSIKQEFGPNANNKILFGTLPVILGLDLLQLSRPGLKPLNIFSPVHVVLVSLLVDQLSGLFLTFFGRPKKDLFSLREFLVSL